MYKNRVITYIDAKHQFRIYRLIRFLHDLRIIMDGELIRHEEIIYDTLPVGINIDWFNYRVSGPGGEVNQF